MIIMFLDFKICLLSIIFISTLVGLILCKFNCSPLDYDGSDCSSTSSSSSHYSSCDDEDKYHKHKKKCKLVKKKCKPIYKCKYLNTFGFDSNKKCNFADGGSTIKYKTDNLELNTSYSSPLTVFNVDNHQRSDNNSNNNNSTVEDVHNNKSKNKISSSNKKSNLKNGNNINNVMNGVDTPINIDKHFVYYDDYDDERKNNITNAIGVNMDRKNQVFIKNTSPIKFNFSNPNSNSILHSIYNSNNNRFIPTSSPTANYHNFENFN